VAMETCIRQRQEFNPPVSNFKPLNEHSSC